jgi:hypothetical protein
MKGMSLSSAALSFLLLFCPHLSLSWQQQSVQRQRTALHVASKESLTKEKDAIPYAVARGDGSTGGGGLTMPRTEDDTELRRPKVGAEMPLGRPSWFRVPAPSQGTILLSS